ncbi:MAG: squalene/phytoene synthase family protein, partial [Acidobacteriia bacterium]|nr:squalene/phytoene synthase family protein [Terriglobia bacterium]
MSELRIPVLAAVPLHYDYDSRTLYAGNGNGNGHGRLEADYARCADITRRSSSNFYYAFMLLPAERRRALHAVYAFCRFIDDIADDESASDAASLLARWREELDRVYGGAPTRAISRALADSAR